MSEANDKDDDALDSYLSGDSELSRRYRSGGDPQPSASVDRAILDAAREEAGREGAEHKEPAAQTRRRRWNLTWERPLAIAAAVTVSAILLVTIQRETGVFPPEDGEIEKYLDDRNGAAAPATRSAEQRPAAPEQQADAAMESGVLSNAPGSSGAARAENGPAAKGLLGNGPSKEIAERESRSLATGEHAIQEALARINTAWMNGESDHAEQLLDSFREAYPDVGEERLRQTLPAALLDKNGSP